MVKPHGGTLIEICGKKGSGKTLVALSICAINSVRNKKIVYVDGSGNFRPDIIESMIGNFAETRENHQNFLKNIIYLRIYEIDDLLKLTKKINILNPDIMILDDIIPLFLYNIKENLHLEIRKFIRELAITALISKKKIFFTNTNFQKKDLNLVKYEYELFLYDIVRYVHFKLYLQMIELNNHKKKINCILLHPSIQKGNIINIYIDIGNT